MYEGTKQMKLTIRHGKLPHESLKHLKTLHDFSRATDRPEIGQPCIIIFTFSMLANTHYLLNRSPEVF